MEMHLLHRAKCCEGKQKDGGQEDDEDEEYIHYMNLHETFAWRINERRQIIRKA